MSAPAERKLHADLIRHRELNALRKVMLRDAVVIASAPGSFLAETAQKTVLHTRQAHITQIATLEQQMDKSLFERT